MLACVYACVLRPCAYLPPPGEKSGAKRVRRSVLLATCTIPEEACNVAVRFVRRVVAGECTETRIGFERATREAATHDAGDVGADGAARVFAQTPDGFECL